MLPWCHLRSPRRSRDLGCAVTGAPGVGWAIGQNRELRNENQHNRAVCLSAVLSSRFYESIPGDSGVDSARGLCYRLAATGGSLKAVLGLDCLRHRHCADYSMARKSMQSATRLILNCTWRLCYNCVDGRSGTGNSTPHRRSPIANHLIWEICRGSERSTTEAARTARHSERRS